MKIAYPGSFDPWTKGHQSVIENIVERDPTVQIEVLIADNPDKRYLFSSRKRKEMIENEIAILNRTNIEVFVVEDLIADYLYEQDIHFIIRGVRNNSKDVSEELDLARINSTLVGNPLTLLIPQTNPLLDVVSSSNLKVLTEYGILTQEYASSYIREEVRVKTSGKPLVGVYGTIASGKSTLCHHLVYGHRGDRIFHINMDEIAHKIYESNLPVHKKITKKIKTLFDIKAIGGGIEFRKELGEVVFSNKAALDTLTNIMLEPILRLMYKEIEKLPRGIILIESAILVERDLLDIVDHNIIHVTCDAEERSKRLKKRGLSKKRINKRINSLLAPVSAERIIKEAQEKEVERLYIKHEDYNTTVEKLIDRYLGKGI